jgi:type IV pilus assembly protein PilY1
MKTSAAGRIVRIASRAGVALLAVSIAASGLLRTGPVQATAAVTPISLSNTPLTVDIPAHPQVVIAMGNSQSMDGDLSGAIMTGSGALSPTAVATGLANSSSPVNYMIPSGFTPPLDPGSGGYAPYTVTSAGVQYDNSASRLNVAKAGITAILNDFVEYADFALMDYQTGAPTTLYSTWVYFMSPDGSTFTFTNTPAASPYVANPCYGANVLGLDAYSQACAKMLAHYGVGSGVIADQYVLVGPAGSGTSDDPAINDVLYAPVNYQPPVCVSANPNHPDPYPLPLPAGTFTLANYNNGSVSEGYGTTYGTGCVTGMRPTNAGYVPFSPESMEAKRGFGYDTSQSATTGNLVVSMKSSGVAPSATTVAAAIAPFTSYLAPETNSIGSTEIKALAEQSPIAGLLQGAKTYLATNPASTNGCLPKRYVVLVTDGLPTEDLAGHSWPPLGSEPGNRYGVTATFNGDGSLDTTNDQALQDAVTKLQALYSSGVKTYVIGLGAGVETAANPQAAATLKAMAIAGGTGDYFAATSPGDLTYDMQVILAQILAANQSTSSATVNTTGLNTTSTAYQPSFDTSDTDQDWTGDLRAYPIDPSTGEVQTTMLKWSAQAQLDTQDAGNGWDTTRIIATWDPVAHAGIPFRWTGGMPMTGIGATTLLGEELQTNFTDPSGQDALNYLRGDHALEIVNGGPYRSRTHVLGDIVDSAPLYVGAATGPYQSTSYYAFAQSHATRSPVLYVGANDGMLHAFDAATGNELFAFIPSGVFSDLNNLTSSYYNEQHRFYADGSPQASDVQFTDGSWHTVLVGGERAGGQTIYALDVTDPASITNESTLASKVLWEFTDGDMGYTYSTPVIAQTAAGATGSNLGFTVFFGNGYNSLSQRPYLYALDPQTGAYRTVIDLCAKVPTACDLSKPNGLSSVVVVNTIGGVGAPNTTVYAGDLQGNLWKVDITSATPADWTATVLFQATDGSGARQPITSVPVVSLNPDFPRLPGVMVYVGTGQMLGIPDLGSTQVQTMYGVYDSGSNPSTLLRSNLEGQTLTALSASLRVVSGGPIALPTESGWYVDLSLLSGERIVTDPRLDSGAVVVTTVQPSSDTCDGGDVAWLMEFNYAGGTFVSPQFDTNGNGSIDAGDTNANGMLLGNVYAAAPVIVKAPCTANCKRVKLITESSGTIQNVTERGSQQQRTSWREIR